MKTLTVGSGSAWPDNVNLAEQTMALADFIMREFPEWPGNAGFSEGAIQCAMRIMQHCKDLLTQIEADPDAAQIAHLWRGERTAPLDT